MKISVFAVQEIPPGKHNIKDEKLDQADKLVKAKKKTYAQVEVTGEDAALEADMIIAAKDAKTDLILRDLDFVETRLGRQPEENEKALLGRMKVAGKRRLFPRLVYRGGTGTCYRKRPVYKKAGGPAQKKTWIIRALWQGLAQSGYLFFLTVGDKENRAWLIKKGTTAWEAAGEIHSDIQKGFIRAEIISFEDFIQAGGETQAKQAGKMRLEQKEYIMQDGDLVNFRFNK
jgi:hypothetical protein